MVIKYIPNNLYSTTNSDGYVRTTDICVCGNKVPNSGKVSSVMCKTCINMFEKAMSAVLSNKTTSKGTAYGKIASTCSYVRTYHPNVFAIIEMSYMMCKNHDDPLPIYCTTTTGGRVMPVSINKDQGSVRLLSNRITYDKSLVLVTYRNDINDDQVCAYINAIGVMDMTCDVFSGIAEHESSLTRSRTSMNTSRFSNFSNNSSKRISTDTLTSALTSASASASASHPKPFKPLHSLMKQLNINSLSNNYNSSVNEYANSVSMHTTKALTLTDTVDARKHVADINIDIDNMSIGSNKEDTDDSVDGDA